MCTYMEQEWSLSLSQILRRLQHWENRLFEVLKLANMQHFLYRVSIYYVCVQRVACISRSGPIDASSLLPSLMPWSVWEQRGLRRDGEQGPVHCAI